MSEQAVQFGRATALAGVLTDVGAGESSLPILVMPRSARLHRAGLSRLTVELARAARASGVRSLRFDLSGCGDSGAAIPGESGEAATVNDISDAMDYLARSNPERRFVLLGVGADLAVIHRVANNDTRVTGVISINGPGFRTLRYWLIRCVRLLSPTQTGRSVPAAKDSAADRSDRDDFAHRVQFLAARGVRMLHIYTGGATERYFNHARQFWSMLPPLDTHGRVAVAYLPTADDSLAFRDDRVLLLDICLDWMLR
jgi:hypothetical protein